MRNAAIRDIMDIAARKRGVEGWVPYKWEAAGDDSIVTGAVPTRTISKGKRKGRPDFTGAKRDVVVVTQAEVEQAASHYERETGKCWDCKGSGQIQVMWSADTGAVHEACARCGGTGKAINKE